MAVQWNPGADNLSASIASLGRALMPDPIREASAMYQAQHAADLRQQMDARIGLSAAVASGAPPEKLAAIAASMGPQAFASMGAMLRATYAAQPNAQANDPRLGVLQMGAGQGYGDTYQGTQDSLANAIKRAEISAGPGYASVAQRRYEFENTPIAMAGGGEGGLPQYVLQGNIIKGQIPPGAFPLVNRSQAEGTMASRVAAGAASPTEAQNAFSWLRGGSNAPPKMLPQVGHTETAAISDQLVKLMPGLDASDPVTTNNRMGLVSMATQAFQQGGNMADAVRSTAQWAREHGATQGRALLWGQGDYNFENMQAPPSAADQGNVRMPVGPGGLPYVPSNMAQALTAGATGLPPAARDEGSGSNGGARQSGPASHAAGIGQPEKAGGGWSQVPEGAVVNQGGKRYRKVNGQPVLIGN